MKVILHYRTTPKGDLPSPSELLMSRSLRTKVPSVLKNLKPKLVNRQKYNDKIELHLKKSCKYYNNKSKNLKPASVGDKVMFKKTPSSCWFPGEVVNSCKEPRSLVVSDSSGSLYRRSLEHIKKTPDNNKENNITEESSGDIEINENNDRPERKN